MKRKLRNVTITLEEQVARWARTEAARNGTSVSRMLGAILKQCILHDHAYKRAMRRALARRAFPMSVSRCLSREEAHDRAGLH